MPACASCVIGGIHKFFMGKSSLPAFYGGGANRLSGGVFWREPCLSKSTSRKRNQWSFVVLMLVPAPGKIHRLFMLDHRTRLVSNLADLDGLAFLMSNRWFGIFITAHTKPDANHILPCGLTRGEYGIDGLFHSRRSRTPEEGFLPTTSDGCQLHLVCMRTTVLVSFDAFSLSRRLYDLYNMATAWPRGSRSVGWWSGWLARKLQLSEDTE
ncbi:hypothetical protein F4824DRAFT_78668 [Ustulina deusta]|nr:hypothetical protein F4824DRAFT_78668 [Ustulina deusta]